MAGKIDFSLSNLHLKRLSLPVLLARELLLDASLLTCEVAQIVELSATNLTNLVHLNRIDIG